MSTHSRIGIEKKDRTIESIYCHWDGYPEHNGDILLNSYNYPATQELIELGDISSLGETTSTTIAYGRDRGEELTQAITHNSKEEYFNTPHQNLETEEYLYLIDYEGNWHMKHRYSDSEVVPLNTISPTNV
jgi:hypothetical protein